MLGPRMATPGQLEGALRFLPGTLCIRPMEFEGRSITSPRPPSYSVAELGFEPRAPTSAAPTLSGSGSPVDTAVMNAGITLQTH